jgi:hypothetical protein
MRRDVMKVNHKTGDGFSDPMIGARLMFLLQLGRWNGCIEYHSVVII